MATKMFCDHCGVEIKLSSRVTYASVSFLEYYCCSKNWAEQLAVG